MELQRLINRFDEEAGVVIGLAESFDPDMDRSAYLKAQQATKDCLNELTRYLIKPND